jgi:S-adenosyl-L-methionine hydrolase (adenosine-forming)
MMVCLLQIRYHALEYKQQRKDLSRKMGKLIALLTDFGTKDIYVGVMKAVLKQICPDAEFVDISHAITAQNIREGALALQNSFHYFPKGTVFLVVVDPGVGSNRKPIFVETEHYCFIAPDNGILSYALEDIPYHAQTLENPEYKLSNSSHTFHGRDVFAPAAAHAASGKRDFGQKLSEIVKLPESFFKVDGGIIEGEIVHIDRFGNLISSIGRFNWQDDILRIKRHQFWGDIEFHAAEVKIDIADTRLFGIKKAYYQVGQGELLAQIDSNGYLEIAVNQGSAEKRLNAKLGTKIRLRLGIDLAH